MPFIRRNFIAFAALLLLAIAQTAGAQLVNNGEFDTNESGWLLADPNPLDNKWQWDSEDAGGQPGSGSARFSNTLADAGGQAWVRQCVTLDGPNAAAGTYLLHFAAKIPGAQSESGSVFSQLTFSSLPDCNGAANIGLATLSPSLSTPGDWYSIETLAVLDQVPASARIAFFLDKVEAAGELDVLLDQVRLEADVVFVDGFESGNTSEWSSTSP